MNRLKELRTSRGITQKDIGKILEVEVAAISKYENEKVSLTEKQLKILAQYFDVSVDYLLGLTNDPYSNLDVTDKMLKDYTSENYEEAQDIVDGFIYYHDLAQKQAGELITYYIDHDELDVKLFNDMLKSIKIAKILVKKTEKLYDNSSTLDLPDDIAEQKGLLEVKRLLELEEAYKLRAEKIFAEDNNNEKNKDKK